MKKINKYNIFVILICAILFGYSIFVGSPIKNNTNIINIIVLLIFLIYIIVETIKNKEYRIIKNKLDIFIILLVLSSYTALIFQNYSNLEATIEYIIKYTSILSMYIMIRDIVTKNRKYINYIIITLIISSISIFILAIDNYTFNFLNKFIEVTRNVEVLNKENRLLGIFGYSNTTAIYMLIISILATGKMIETKNIKQKILYGIVVLINITTIVLTYSRSVWIIGIITYIIYISIISIHYKKKINTKIHLKYVLGLLILMFLTIIILWNVFIKFTEPLILFNDVNTKQEPTQDITNVKPNTLYKFEFDIDSQTGYNTDDIYEIQICERNKYDDILITHKIEFGRFKGIKTIEFSSTEYTHKFLLKFITKNRVAQRGLTINQLKINDEVKPLKYKFLPTKLVEKVYDINFKTISVTERFEYMKDACKLISKYGMLGIGADGWKDRQLEVQDYYNFTNETHSYILEIFLEFGIIGFIAFIGIVIQILIKVIKLIKNRYYDAVQISIMISILVLIIHSCIDFDLSFMYMLILLFTLIATLEMENKDYKKLDLVMKIIVVFLITISIYFNAKICLSIYVDKKENPYSVEAVYNNLVLDDNFSDNIDEIIKRRKYISHINLFRKLMYEKDLKESEIIKLYDVIKSEKQLSPNDTFEKLNRINFYKDILLKIKDNYIHEDCKNNILLEIKEVKKLLSNPEKCRLGLDEIECCNEILEYIEKEVK